MNLHFKCSPNVECRAKKKLHNSRADPGNGKMLRIFPGKTARPSAKPIETGNQEKTFYRSQLKLLAGCKGIA